MTSSNETCIVINGRSFVGKYLVVRLLKLGHWIVKVAGVDHSLKLDLDDYEFDLPLNRAVSTGRAAYVCVDVRDTNSIVNGIHFSSHLAYIVDVVN